MWGAQVPSAHISKFEVSNFITLSIGVVAAIPQKDDDPATRISADKALYQARREGKNRVREHIWPASRAALSLLDGAGRAGTGRLRPRAAARTGPEPHFKCERADNALRRVIIPRDVIHGSAYDRESASVCMRY
jgi:hypothetical protein